jgi:ribosomal protein L3 glutamine methyltransferase
MKQQTVAEAIEQAARALRGARVFFGHGTDNARDEAAEMVFFCAGLAHSLGAKAYRRALSVVQSRQIARLLLRRIRTRKPLPYLTRRAFFAGLELYVDERVLVPRSPIAELILGRFQPWVEPRRVKRILDIGTGSGAIAIACAKSFPATTVDAVDLSRAALTVCRRNVKRHHLTRRVRVIYSDHFTAVRGRRYDIIVSNPPYVGEREMRSLPAEYRREPRMALAAGADGLDDVRIILAGAAGQLNPQGLLVMEVGNTERELQRKFSRLPFIWPQLLRGGGGVFLLRAADLLIGDSTGVG